MDDVDEGEEEEEEEGERYEPEEYEPEDEQLNHDLGPSVDSPLQPGPSVLPSPLPGSVHPSE
jgi:hypothetical protein